MAVITGGVVTFGACSAAVAAPTLIRFNVEPEPYAEALLDVAQQANVTLIGAGACPGVSRERLTGSMTLEQALNRVLAGAPCAWKVIAPGAVEITAVRQAEAEAVKPAPPVTVGELLVTATRRVRDPRQLAVAITAVPRQQLQATGATDAGEAAGQLAGVLATNLGPGRNKLLLRGLSDGAYTGRSRSTVATYLDDIPINYNAPDPDLRLVDVERVEVARGPQGALYGAGSMSGIYRIVTSRPDLRRYSAELRATGATTKGGDPSGAVEGYLNVPLWGVAGVRLSGYEEIQGGYLDNPILGRSNVDKTERRGGRINLSLQPNDAWAVNLTALGQHLRSDDTHYTTPGLGTKRGVLIAEPHVNDIELATGTIRRSWGWGELSASTGYVRHAYGSLYDATATQLNYTSFAKTSAFSERSSTKMFVQDIMLASRGASRFEWLVGVYGSDTSQQSPTQFLAQNPFAPNAVVYGEERSDDIRELAAYGEVSYQPAKNWTLAVGGRAFNIHSHIVSDVISERFLPRHVDQDADFTSFAPKISLQRQLASGDLVYAVYSEGYRAGGVNTGGAQPLSETRETYAPDRLRNLELGVKLRAMENRLAVNSAVFYDLWKDIQTDQFRGSGIAYTTNAGDAHILGLESEVAYRTDNGFTAQFNGRLSRVRTTNANADFTVDLANGLPGAPAVSGGALLSYERAVYGDWMLRLVGQATYVGKSRITFDTSLPKMGGYTTAKILAELSAKGRGVQLYVANPANAFSDTFAFGNPFNPPPSVRQITPQRPLTLGLTLFAAL